MSAGAFGFVGLVEDLRGIEPRRRLAIQCVAAGAALPWLLGDLSGPTAWEAIFAAGVWVWMVAYVNAFNFMDGINGISVAQALISGLAWCALGRWHHDLAVATGGVILAGAAAGFAPFNFPRARMFLGDVGSYFLGAWSAAVVVLGLRAGLPPEAILAPVSLYLADTITTIVRRIRTGEPWYLPHRRHAYQQLVQLGWSHTRTTLSLAAIMATCCALGVVSLATSLPARVASDIGLFVILGVYVSSPGIIARRGQIGAVTS
jgi:UDP-N-acetylmuramyl pentapeptide phosphotransferase/UDP-N-acetylglucosamine-1-phosphate transferase